MFSGFSHTAQRSQDTSKFWAMKKNNPVFHYLSANKLISEDNSVLLLSPVYNSLTGNHFPEQQFVVILLTQA